MAHSLSRILPEEIASRLARFGILTAADLFTSSPLHIMAVLGIGLEDTNKLLCSVGEKIAPSSSSAYEILRRRVDAAASVATCGSYISTGIAELDLRMKGGLPVGMISEIAGSPGSGKTQFCLGCIAEVARNSSSRVIVFDTELKFNVDRLKEIVMEREIGADITSILSRVIIKRPLTCRALFQEIDELESLVISEGIKLIVIDSIASLARKEGLQETDKETFLVRQASTLKLIAELCHCAIIVTNQVASSTLLTTDHEAVNPSLGPIWNHCISTRLTIQKLQEQQEEQQPPQSYDGSQQSQQQLDVGGIVLESERIIRVAKSPALSSVSLRCQIKKVGLQASAS
jgi:RAD51-like protein 1